MYGTLVQVLANIGIVFVSLGLACGDAGPVTAIENQKSAITTVVAAILSMKVPNGLQIGGLIAGLVGMCIIACQDKQD